MINLMKKHIATYFLNEVFNKIKQNIEHTWFYFYNIAILNYLILDL